MKLFKNKKQLQKEIRKFDNISFVPTMGALHKGHESIIRKSVKRSGKTLVSIFVNPKQFNNKKDLDTYPKNNRNDLLEIEQGEVSVLSEYLPRQLNEEDTKKICSNIISSSGASSLKDMGRVMSELKNKPVFSVQYHPESNPGPQDSHYLFNDFIKEIKKYAKKKRH